MTRASELVKEWLSRAADDLRLAERALSGDPPVCWGAAFHAQQAAEKALKAFLTFHCIEFARSHSIDYLLDLCATVETGMEELRSSAGRLTDFAVDMRYPFPRPGPSEAEAREAIETAGQVCQLVHGLLPTDLTPRT